MSLKSLKKSFWGVDTCVKKYTIPSCAPPWLILSTDTVPCTVCSHVPCGNEKLFHSRIQRPMKCSFYMWLCCNYIRLLQCSSASLHVFLINNAVLRFRFGEKENQCTFVLHERAFSSVCLFSDSALGKRLQHKHFTATCARGHTFCTVDGEELDSTWD